MEKIDGLEEKVMLLIKARQAGKLSDLRQYHEALSDLDRELLESIFTETWVRGSFYKKPMGYAERMGLIIAKYPDAYKPWDKNQEEKLIELHNGGKSISEIGELMLRQKGAISARLKRLGVIK
ncbi:MAG TPA: hypothetical protein VJH23_02920 [archaeon]|nr:hypothetical protein [archaeon]